MKRASGYITMCCFMLIVIAIFINETRGFCELNNMIGMPDHDCSMYKDVYPIYKKLESILTNDTETLYLMRQAFFPAIVAHFLEPSETVNTVRIRVCWRPPPAINSLDNNNDNQTATEKRCKNFRWSRSPALNMIAVEQLLGFDPVFTTWIYSRFVDHTYRRSFELQFNMSSVVFSRTPTEEELTQATILLLTWSKAYAKAQGVPTTWSQDDQGYIARWYSYYSAEAYYRSEEIEERIRIVLFIVFVLLNLIILHITITRGTKWRNLYPENLQEEKSSVYLAVGITSIVFNLSYLIFSALVYPVLRYTMAECTAISDWNCLPPHNSSLYQTELAAFFVKLLVIISAIITDIVVVIISSKETQQFTPELCHNSKRYKVFQLILLGNAFVFVQIWAGLISLPACILLLIAPLQTISALCAAVLFVAVFAASILYLKHNCGTNRNHPNRTRIRVRMGVDFLGNFILVVLTDALIIGLGFLYFNLLPQGGSLSIRAVFISLLPTVLLSLGSWVVRKKFFTNQSGAGTRQSPDDSVELMNNGDNSVS